MTIGIFYNKYIHILKDMFFFVHSCHLISLVQFSFRFIGQYVSLVNFNFVRSLVILFDDSLTIAFIHCKRVKEKCAQRVS